MDEKHHRLRVFHSPIIPSLSPHLLQGSGGSGLTRSVGFHALTFVLSLWTPPGAFCVMLPLRPSYHLPKPSHVSVVTQAIA